MTPVVLVVLGIAAAAAGGELFVRGLVGLAVRLRVAPGIVGATVAAFATSSPELSVGVNSALEGTPEVALGDALGSNVVNVALVLGVALAIAGLTPRRADLNRDLPVALIAPLVTLGLAADGTISRIDGGILLASFGAWLVVTIRQAVHERDGTVAVLAPPGRRRAVVRDAVAGLVLLVVAGRLIVLAAKGIGELLGWDAFTVGALLVAVGTSTPELATTIMARVRGYDAVSVGTVLGSNIFNGLLVIGVASVITPIDVAVSEIALTVAAGVLSLLLVLPGSRNRLGRRRGALLVSLYAGYLVVLLSFRGA
ncbi:sodium:calcium antiporter [Actinotalea sp.]|uniref:sodium:calcium antiporter n=1 Tax=Actinotalea sp. TaxID=1872145 RepID=UPI00356ABB5A